QALSPFCGDLIIISHRIPLVKPFFKLFRTFFRAFSCAPSSVSFALSGSPRQLPYYTPFLPLCQHYFDIFFGFLKKAFCGRFFFLIYIRFLKKIQNKLRQANRFSAP
ncbi:MAG: hypothetical protein MSA49_00550, partial [Clostridia bacterium]|nr:hypothetical protein [Clostridia bacterium]